MSWAQSYRNFNDLCDELLLKRPQNELNIDNIAELALDVEYILAIAIAFRPFILDIISRLILGKFNKVDVLRTLSLLLAPIPSSLTLVEYFLRQHGRDLFTSESNETGYDLLLSMYRVIRIDTLRLSQYLPTEILYEYLQKDNEDIRGVAVICLSTTTQASENLTHQWLDKFLGSDGDHTKFTAIPFVEAQRVTMAKRQLEDHGCSLTMDVETSNLHLSSLVANIGGILVIKQPNALSNPSKFIKTPTTASNIRSLAIGLLGGKPILIKGARGSGKTTCVEYLHSELADPRKDMIRIHLGDQTDVKSLIGTYTTGEKPGTFEWRPGLLTIAVTHGHWVLIEDLDKVPTETLSVLLPMLEKRQLVIPSRNQTINAHPDFMLFSTITADLEAKYELNIIGKRMWSIINISPLNNADLSQIIDERHPMLTRLCFRDRFITIYNEIADGMKGHLSSDKRVLTTRDLFKLVTRVNKLLDAANINTPAEAVSSSLLDDVFRELVSCFAGFLSSGTKDMYLAELIGCKMDIGISKVTPLLFLNKPEIAFKGEHLVKIGRATLPVMPVTATRARQLESQRSNYALTCHGLRMLEEIAVASSAAEPLLLVGETGTGKTTTIQYLANLAHQKLVVINISQQIETGDLVGGYKPVDLKHMVGMLSEDFNELFSTTFSRSKNQQFIEVLERASKREQWANVFRIWREAHKMAAKLFSAQDNKRRKITEGKTASSHTSGLESWNTFMSKLSTFEKHYEEVKKSLVFQFVEGMLVKAVQQGHWVLLDEINLAPADTLEGISDLLSTEPSITLVEKGGEEDSVVKAHPNFRLFACMNPATDVGKKDLPISIRSRFTELYVASPDSNVDDLREIVGKYLDKVRLSDNQIVHDVASLYLEAKRLAEGNLLVDGAGQKPHFSIRTLSRTLLYSCSIVPIYGLRRALYEGFCMTFLTLLNKPSIELLLSAIESHILGGLGNARSIMAHVPTSPGTEYIQFKHYWLRKGQDQCSDDENYIVTASVEQNLLNLVRATTSKKFPVLIQGPTSSGKTSMIRYLAKKTGHQFVRINNHEHTDLQEYLGTYVSDDDGSLVFKEGILVEALRSGYWIVLDELNLAPTDVLEALNRLLDDNRELLIPETQEVVKPHPDFMLFATQNPPGMYAGRKTLSRAFRNRFLELHFDDIPESELEVILKDRCKIAPSYARKIVETYRELGQRRQGARLFEQKGGFATLRDLFRWACRPAISYEELALNGYFLLAERVRNPQERQIVREVLEKVMRVEVQVNYGSVADKSVMSATGPDVVWTDSLKRLLVLIMEAVRQNEPVLLVGETGCGKTTICQILAEAFKKPLHIVNAHQNTETSDLLGAMRPVRGSNSAEAVNEKLVSLLQKKLRIEDSSLTSLKEAYQRTAENDRDSTIDSLLKSKDALFEWHDGSLVTALKDGNLFLLDEISLAEDSVLERLNSVLEPERSLLLPEKGSGEIDISAKEGFQFFATMNPGGDYGKKELSPALRNRFTEIWVPSMENMADVNLIVSRLLVPAAQKYSSVITEFAEWFGDRYGNGDVTSGVISLRDILHWVEFINQCSKDQDMDLPLMVFHGACMVFIDSIGSNSLAHLAQNIDVLTSHRSQCRQKIGSVLGLDERLIMEDDTTITIAEKELKVGPYLLARSDERIPPVPFSVDAPTTATNTLRIVRAMKVNKPILLEGSPGVGKTSLIAALAILCGKRLTRINLSDQTDLVDLFGSDVPAEGASAGRFVWRDAPFLRAMKAGEWVLLDEMNLASQSVLEGLNACLDHRGEAYIPELDRTFRRHPEFLVFAAQNPQIQGGGRKGLPKSFVNRFSVVYMDSLSLRDLETITGHLYPEISLTTRSKLSAFIEELAKVSQSALGGPFEFNLRDTLRWFDLLKKYSVAEVDIGLFFNIIVNQRFRTSGDKDSSRKLFEKHFGQESIPQRVLKMSLEDTVKIGYSSVSRMNLYGPRYHSVDLHCNMHLLESAIACVANNWPLLLVGPTASGKTCFIRYLASLCGGVLKEFSVNSDIDSTDLLGEFDQIEKSQQLSRLWGRVQEYLTETADRNTTDYFLLLTATEQENIESVRKILLKVNTSDARHIISEIDSFLSTDFSRPIFKWFDGMLISAVERGHWLVLDNANLCNPSVLDRLNSLLEPGGVLLVNECCEENGEPRKIVPHPNFRLFLTADPKYGELSRAMRNRSVELYMEDLSIRSEAEDKAVLTGCEIVSNLEAIFLDFAMPSRLSDALRLTKEIHWMLPSVYGRDRSQMLDARYFTKDFDLVKQLMDYTDLFSTIADVSDYCLWVYWRLKQLLQWSKVSIERSTPEKGLDLLRLSQLKRFKTSVKCADVASFIDACISLTLSSADFAMVLFEFASFCVDPNYDASRIPIYRELLYDAARPLPADMHDKFVYSLPMLGKEFDFTSGGSGLERLWSAYSVGGFSSSEAASFYDNIKIQAEALDDACSGIRGDLIEEIIAIRGSLSQALSFAHVDTRVEMLPTLTDGVIKIQNAASRSTKTRTIFSDSFKRVFNHLSQSHIVQPDEKLRRCILLCGHISGFGTETLSELFTAGVKAPLYLPRQLSVNNMARELLHVLASRNNVLMDDTVAMTEELRLLCNLLSDVPLIFGTEHTRTTTRILRRFIDCTVETVPESEETLSHLHSGEVDSHKAWIEFGHTLVDLYICPLIFDPAIRQHTLYELNTSRRAEFEGDLQYWRTLRSVFIGDAESSEDMYLKSKIEGLDDAAKPNVFRPPKSQISDIYSDLSKWGGLLTRSRTIDLSREASELWIKNVDMLLEKLWSYEYYRDFTSIIVTACRCIRYGVESNHSETSVDNSYDWMIDATILSCPEEIPEHVAKLGNVSSQVALLALKCCAIHRNTAPATIDSLLRTFYTKWKIEQTNAEEKARQDAATYHLAGESGDESDFKQLFPDFETDLEESAAQDTTLENGENTDMYLVKVFHALMGTSDSLELPDVLRDAVLTLSPIGRKLALTEVSQILPAIYLALRDTFHYVDSGKPFNFYKESNYTESQKATKLARDVVNRVQSYLAKWPEHDTLLNIAKTCEDLMKMPISCPLAMTLMMLERLHGSLDEWQRYATKDVSVSDLIDNIVDLIVAWRRLELSTWPKLFEYERLMSEREGAKFWYYLYEILVVAPGDLIDISQSLLLFISESSYSQYHHRIWLLKSFSKFVSDYKIRSAILNVVGYFAQFDERVNSAAHGKEKLLIKEIEEIVLLASWKDVNIHALRQSAQRSHRSLYKVVRKYREFVNTKVTTLMECPDVSKHSISDANNHFNDTTIDTESAETHFSGNRQWEARPSHLKNLHNTQRMIRGVIAKLSSHESDYNLKTLSEDVMREAERLRKETPKTMSPDNKKLVGFLKMEKSKLLTNTLHTLSDSGLSSRIRQDLMGEQSLLSQVLADSPCLYGAPLDPVNVSFYAFVEIMPRVRSAVSESTSDCPVSSLQRGQGYLENIFSRLLKSRRTAHNACQSSGFDGISQILKSIQFISDGHVSSATSVTLEGDGTALLVTSRNIGQVSNQVAPDLALPVISPPATSENKMWWRTISAYKWMQESLAKIRQFSDALCETSTGPHALLIPLAKKWSTTKSIEFDELTPTADATPESTELMSDEIARVSNIILVILQGALAAISQVESDADETEKWFTYSCGKFDRMISSLRMPSMKETLDRIVEGLLSIAAVRYDESVAFATILMPFVVGYANLCSTVIKLHSKFQLEISTGAVNFARLLISLSNEGFCAPQEPENESQDEKMESGTGLGDGEGGQSTSKDVDEEDDDVSEAMQTANPEQGDRDEADEDHAKEMNGEMEGKVEDAPVSEDEEDKEGDQDADEDEIEEEVGDLDSLDPNAVDEKMWNDQEEDDTSKEKNTDKNVDGNEGDDKEANENTTSQSQHERETMEEPGADDDLSENSADESAEDAEEEDANDKIQQGEQLEDNVDERDALNLPDDVDMNQAQDELEEPSEDDHDALEDGPVDPLDAPSEHESDAADAMDSPADDNMEVENQEDQIEDSDLDASMDGKENSDQEKDAASENEDPTRDETAQLSDAEEPQGENAEAEASALHGGDDNMDADEEQSLATQQQNGTSSNGADQTSMDVQENADNSGSLANSMPQPSDLPPPPAEADETATQELQESLRQLGDAMEEFHRQKRDIIEKTGKEDKNIGNDDNVASDDQELYEHVGEDDPWDTQALGKSTEYQNIDQKPSVDDDEEDDTNIAPEDELIGGQEEMVDVETVVDNDSKSMRSGMEAEPEDAEESQVHVPSILARQSLTDSSDSKDMVEKATMGSEDPSEVPLQLATQLWNKYDAKTHDLTLILSEQLRLILEPTVATKLRGDYKTGKRLNMKRIIPYIASDFKKDKIWLRRTKPAKRQYQVSLALDDSRSMGEPQVVDLAYQAIALVCKALSQMEAGQISVMRFGESTQVVHPLEKQFTSQSGAEVLSKFTFSQNRTDVRQLVRRSLELFEKSRNTSSSEKWQLELIVSDGICEDHDELRTLVRRAHDQHVMLVFIILDALNKDTSILDMNQVNYSTDSSGSPTLHVDRYMDQFPFEYYVIVRNIKDLPNVLASVLRQYFQAVDV